MTSSHVFARSRGKVPFAEPSYMQGFKSPYFDEPLGGGLRGLEGSPVTRLFFAAFPLGLT